jgi:uncharacterized membrane protein YqgA involved in biofilm formation
VLPGTGTAVNAVTVLIGSTAGVLVGHRLAERTRSVVTDALGLVTLLIAASSAWSVTDPALSRAVGHAAPMLIVLGSLLLGGIAGSVLRVEDRLEGLGGHLQRLAARRTPGDAGRPEVPAGRERFVQGFVTASLVFCVGPLTVLGSLSEGLGDGPDQLFLKAALDGFASIAFAASFGWGVAAAAVVVVVVQGTLTVLGAVLGNFLPDAHLAALTATGGLLLVGVGLRLLEVKRIRVADLLPALVVAPVLTQIVTMFR